MMILDSDSIGVSSFDCNTVTVIVLYRRMGVVISANNAQLHRHAHLVLAKLPWFETAQQQEDSKPDIFYS